MNRRQLIKGIGAAICAGMTPSFLPSLIEPVYTTGTELFYKTLAKPGKTLLSFDQMLGQYLTDTLLRNELTQPDYSSLWTVSR